MQTKDIWPQGTKDFVLNVSKSIIRANVLIPTLVCCVIALIMSLFIKELLICTSKEKRRSQDPLTEAQEPTEIKVEVLAIVLHLSLGEIKEEEVA